MNVANVPSPSFQHCSNLWTIKGCAISQIGDTLTSDFMPVNTGTWAVGPATKGCLAAKAYQSYAFSSVANTGASAWEKYTFTVRRVNHPKS